MAETGMDALGRAIADGRIGFGETLDMLTAAHIRMFGTPNTRGGINRLEERLSQRLVELTERYADPGAQEWSWPRLLPEHTDKLETGVERGWLRRVNDIER